MSQWLLLEPVEAYLETLGFTKYGKATHHGVSSLWHSDEIYVQIMTRGDEKVEIEFGSSSMSPNPVWVIKPDAIRQDVELHVPTKEVSG
jgi:hypothetical protein